MPFARFNREQVTIGLGTRRPVSCDCCRSARPRVVLPEAGRPQSAARHTRWLTLSSGYLNSGACQIKAYYTPMQRTTCQWPEGNPESTGNLGLGSILHQVYISRNLQLKARPDSEWSECCAMAAARFRLCMQDSSNQSDQNFNRFDQELKCMLTSPKVHDFLLKVHHIPLPCQFRRPQSPWRKAYRGSLSVTMFLAAFKLLPRQSEE